jgi:hypothetical protein
MPAALRFIEHERGELLDPDVVDACLRLFRERRFLMSEGARRATSAGADASTDEDWI